MSSAGGMEFSGCSLGAVESAMETSRPCMWGHQAEFQAMALAAAQRLCDALDPALAPQVVLIGVPLHPEPDEGRHERTAAPGAVCLEPEDGYDPALFAHVGELAQRLLALDEERQLIHSHPITQEDHLRRLKAHALRSAIHEITHRHDEQRGLATYCALPAPVQGYRVCPVLQVNRDAVHAYYKLTRGQADGHTLATSLLGAAIQEFLHDCTEALLRPNPGARGDPFERDAAELMRAAGKALMTTAALAGGEPEGVHGLLHACNIVSAMRYEGAETAGRLVVARRGHPGIEVTMTLAAPVPLREYRAVRKLLEISSSEIGLLSDSASVYGLGQVGRTYDPRDESVFTVQFTSHDTWELQHAGHLLMRAIYGQPQLPRGLLDEANFRQRLRAIFAEIEPKQTRALWELAAEAAHQKHGTLLVVSAGAAAEAERLEKQCIRVEPVRLAPELVQPLTSIDGALLIDPGGVCHAIGVILDGLASPHGTAARGARYNSAVRYVETSKYPCLAVVVSEDGTIDMLPA
jgi:hypothetical protein